MSETGSTNKINAQPAGASTGPPPPPPAPPQIFNNPATICSSKTDASSPVEPHDSVVEKLVQKLIDWGTLGGCAALVISRYVHHISQIGPKCGLVALNMALSVYLERPVTVEELLDIARNKRFTNHGEMFCANNLMQLALHYLPEQNVEIIDSKLLRRQEFVAEVISSGNLLLVPYDSSRNFSPECLQGHKAHWAIITGIIIPTNSHFSISFMRSLEPGAEATQEAKQHLPAKCLHVLALQGKSRHLSAWLLQDLVDSNENLRQLDPEREASELEYIVPEGGLGKGLCGKAILLRHP